MAKKPTRNNKVIKPNNEPRSVTEVTRAHFSGPLPPPSIFREYADIIPDAPERILAIFEKDSDSARELPLLALEAQKQDNSRTHWMAWSLVVMAFAVSVVFAFMGKDILAGTVIGTTLVAIVIGFLKSRNHD